ncbi:MAG: hypothetical protein M1825_003375 [Sarcosagium campestre]|nr:MAG: hypothetical protein M1825_003375 [Sarcosagium campestre]
MSMDPSSAPLADYFWIAGVDSLSYGQHLQLNPTTGEKTVTGVAAPPVESTIEEDRALEADTQRQSGDFSENGEISAHRRTDSFQRLSRLSNEARMSIQSVSGEQLHAGTGSNRSSVTIKAVQPNGQANGSGLSDYDFDRALLKFTSERDSFLDELTFSAGTVVQKKPATHPKAQRLTNADVNGVKTATGSVRRRISFRELSSMKRQPSMARTASMRTTKRLSNYNSVIPAPQPINRSPAMHPLKRRFEPVLLDRYPPRGMVEETNRRGPFPDYVPMFAFPNDINIVSADERPRSTWHGFAMTSGDNSKIYGICTTIWMPLNPKAAEEVERQCEEWRRDNMTNEERELAISLGERLAVERAKLSELLAQLPTVPSDSSEREMLDEQISATDEKIGLMTDLLRPIRHGATAKIDGLTDGETGLWIPRVYGVLGRDVNMTSFWKEWLRAVIVPMTAGGVLRVPPSSPKVGMWQPLERYVINLCAEALSPVSSKTQVEVAIRELRLFARKEAVNELPGSRNTDLYALFRSLSVQNIVALFEFALSESRIILLSSHTAMLHLASKALTSLLYPMVWNGIFIPVLPARLLSAVEAPCPYIVGIERRYENIELPEDDFVLVDLDNDTIQSTAAPMSLPRQQRRKLVSLLQLAAPHHNRYGVPVGPPAYAIESFPFDAFSSENPSVFTANAAPSTLAKYAGLNSTSFGNTDPSPSTTPLVFNAFLQSKAEPSRSRSRPSTSSTVKCHSPPSPGASPMSPNFPPIPTTPISRSDSGFHLTATLREKRSGLFDSSSRRSSSFGTSERSQILRRPSIPFSQHSSSPSTSTLANSDNQSTYKYAPSTYAQSTIAASTVMPNVLLQPVKNTESTNWVEGHCLQWRLGEGKPICSVCDERADDGVYKCNGCDLNAHSRCAGHICLPCTVSFHPDQIQAAFVRCFASLFYTYRKHMYPATGDQKKAGKTFRFNMDGFLKSVPRENSDYLAMLRQTQGLNEFIHERETKPLNDPSIMLFDQVILAKRNRGRTSMFSKSNTSFLQENSDHLWRSAAANPPNSRFPGDYRQVTSRIPAKLDPTLMKEPRVIQGAPRISTARARRKPIPSMLGPNLPTNGYGQISPE